MGEVEKLKAKWRREIEQGYTSANKYEQLCAAIEADQREGQISGAPEENDPFPWHRRREGREGVIRAWLTYRGPGQGIYVREYEAGGRTWYRDGEGMKLLPGESIEVTILVPIDQHPEGGETP